MEYPCSIHLVGSVWPMDISSLKNNYALWKDKAHANAKPKHCFPSMHRLMRSFYPYSLFVCR